MPQVVPVTDDDWYATRYYEYEGIKYHILQINVNNYDKLFKFSSKKEYKSFIYLNIDWRGVDSDIDNFKFLWHYILENVDFMRYTLLDQISGQNSIRFLEYSAGIDKGESQNLNIKLNYRFKEDTNVISCKNAVIILRQKGIPMEYLKNWNISFESMTVINFIDQNHGFYCITKSKGISWTVWSAEKWGINFEDFNNAEYLDILQSNEENYIIIIPFTSVKEICISDLNLDEICFKTFYKSLNVKLDVQTDASTIFPLELIPDTTPLSIDIDVPKSTQTHAILYNRASNSEAESFKSALLNVLKTKNVKAIKGLEICPESVDLSTQVINLIQNSKTLNHLFIGFSSYEQFLEYLEILSINKSLLTVWIRTAALTKVDKEILNKVKDHFKHFWHRSYLVNFDCHLKSFELKSFPFVEYELRGF